MLNKDDDLVELQLIDKVHQLGNFITLLKLYVVLAETVQSQLRLVLDQHLGRVAHELAASNLDLL